MTVSYGRFVWVGLAAMVVTTTTGAQQPSVDCARPVNWTEQMLCADTSLMELHVRLQRAHDERRRLLDGEAYLDLVSYHHGWLRGREECRTANDVAAQKSCLSDIYLTRIAQLERKPGAPASAPPAAAATTEPALLACRGTGPGWVMEMGASFARLRIDPQGAVQPLQGRVTQSSSARTLAWRGRTATDGTDTVALVLDQSCTVEGEGARYAMTARVLLPDGSILSGCCQRAVVAAPVPAPSAPVAIPNLDIQGGEGGLYAPGTTVRLREVDGANVALRRSARISSGNILARVRAGSVGSVEQTAIREGTSWYFLAMRGSALEGWVMADLVEPVVAMATLDPVTQVPPEAIEEEPASSTRVPLREEATKRSAENGELGAPEREGFQGAMSPVSRPWWRLVAPHIPVIDACIAKARLRTARIVSVEAEGTSTRHVYARDGLNTRIACTVRKGQPVKARALGHKDSFPQIGALFTRAPAQPPSATCYRNNRVVDPRSKALLGWMSYLKPGRRCR